MTDVVVFLGLVAVIGAAGIAIGMLVAPRLDRLTTPPDEDPGDRDDSPDST
ncbi:MAG: hypothetical protein ACJ761_06180 [Chloroflexota bacterium]